MSVQLVFDFLANKPLFRIRSCTLSVLMSKSSCDVGKTTFFKKSHATGIDRKSLSLVCPSEVHKERGQ